MKNKKRLSKIGGFLAVTVLAATAFVGFKPQSADSDDGFYDFSIVTDPNDQQEILNITSEAYNVAPFDPQQDHDLDLLVSGRRYVKSIRIVSELSDYIICPLVAGQTDQFLDRYEAIIKKYN